MMEKPAVQMTVWIERFSRRTASAMIVKITQFLMLQEEIVMLLCVEKEKECQS